MAVFADLLLLVKGNTSDLDKKLSGAEKSVATFSRRLGELGSSVTALGAKLSLGITAPLVGFATAALESRGKMDQLERGLVAITGSSSAATAQLVQLREVANATLQLLRSSAIAVSRR